MNNVFVGLFVLAVLAMQGCEQVEKPTEPVKISEAELQKFISALKKELVFVEGGEFLMGDFGTQYAPERAPYDRDQDSKPLHKVQLSSYSINKFKVTNDEYQFYLMLSGLQMRNKGMASKRSWDSINSDLAPEKRIP